MLWYQTGQLLCVTINILDLLTTFEGKSSSMMFLLPFISWLFGSIVRSHSAATKWKGRQYFHSTYRGFPIWTRVNDWKSRFLFQKLAFSYHVGGKTIPLKCSYTLNLIQISWRETSVIKVYMILKNFRIFFLYIRKKTTWKKRHDKNTLQYTSKTKLPLAGMACFGLLSHFVLGWSRSSCFWGCLSFRKISKLHGQGDPIATWDLIWHFFFGGDDLEVLRWLVRFQPSSGKRGREYENSRLWIAAMNLRYLYTWDIEDKIRIWWCHVSLRSWGFQLAQQCWSIPKNHGLSTMIGIRNMTENPWSLREISFVKWPNTMKHNDFKPRDFWIQG